MSLKSRGFTVLELVLALGLFAVVMAGVSRVLLTQKRLYRELGQRTDLSDNLRAAGEILSSELWSLDAVDGDILAMAADSIRIRAQRAFSGTCGPLASPLRLRDDLTFGVRDFAVGDSLLVYSSPDSAWRTSVVTSAPTRVSCPDSLVTPVRSFEVVTYRSYRASDGAYYIGVRDAGGLQPIAGPLAPAGLFFTFFDSSGAPTVVPGAVAAIGVRIQMLSAEPVTRRGVTGLLEDSLVTRVFLRNNPLGS